MYVHKVAFHACSCKNILHNCRDQRLFTAFFRNQNLRLRFLKGYTKLDSQLDTRSTCSEGRLLNAFLGPLQLMEQHYLVLGKKFTIITPENVDALLDLYIEQGQLDSDPYWLRVWPSSVALAELILARPELVKDKVVADLGCGLGLAGLAAAFAGARKVVLLDREPLALRCALESARASGIKNVVDLETLATNHQHISQMSTWEVSRPPLKSTEAALGGDKSNLSSLAQDALGYDRDGNGDVVDTSSVSARVFDWNAAEPVIPRYDVLLACDVLYESAAIDPIAKLLPLLLRADNGLLLLADPPLRTVANREGFVQKVQKESKLMTLRLQEESQRTCCVQQLDAEMTGGVKAETMAVQLLIFQSDVSNSTIRLKA